MPQAAETPGPTQQELSDADLLRAYLATGSRERLDEIVRRHAPLVRGVCRRVLADDAATADDAAQATFLLLMRKRDRLRDDTVLARWLYWTARHVARSARRSALARRRREIPGLELSAQASSARDDEPRRELLERVEEAFAALPEPQREAILLHHVRGLPLDQAAREAGCPMRTLQSRMSRGLARLRERIARGGEPASLSLVLATLEGGRSATASLIAGVHTARPEAVQLAASVAKGTALLKGSLLLAAVALAATAAATPLLVRSTLKPAAVASAQVATLSADGVLGRHRGDHVFGLAFAPDGRSVASGGEDEAIIWDLGSRSPRARLPHATQVRSLAFTPDGGRLLTGGEDGIARIWDLARGGDPLLLRGHHGSIFRVALSPDGATAATGSDDCAIRLWRTADGAPLRTLAGHRDCLRGLAFASGDALVSGANDRTVRAWPADAARPAVTVAMDSSVVDLAVSPDGERIAVAAGGEVTVRDARSLATLAHLPADAKQALCARFSPDGALVATGGGEGVLRLWDARRGERIAELRMPREIVCLAFSPDGTRIATGSWGPEVSLIRVARCSLIRVAR